MQLRKYQEEMIEQARVEIRNGNRRIIIHAATGSGKTVIASAIVQGAIEKGKKVLFLAHFRQLVYQAIERFTEFGIGDEVGIIMAGEDSNLEKPVQVASIQTYARRIQLEDPYTGTYRWMHDADLVIYDEAHSSIAKTRKDILEMYKDNAIILGLTASPCRADNRGLGEVYESIVSCVGIGDLTEQNYLVPVVYYGCQELPNLKEIPMVAGDYNKKILGERVDKPKLIGDIYENWMRLAGGQQTIVFATNVKHSKHIRDFFLDKGISIEHVDAHTPEDERQATLRRFKDGDTQIVTNVGVFSEGFDAPYVTCMVLARPSKSYGRYMQMAGRGLRPYQGKKECIIIDHAGLVNRHGFLDDPVEWTLDGKETAWKKKTVRKKESKILECEECGLMFTGRVCPQCGTSVKDYGKKIAAIDYDLEEITKTKKKEYTREEKRRFYAMLESERRKRGFAEGWVSHKFRRRFGVWPKGMKDVRPIEPDIAMVRWLKSEFIRYIKGKEKKVA